MAMTDDKWINGLADARRIEGPDPDGALRDATGKPGSRPGLAAAKAARTSADAAERRATSHA